MGNRDKSLQPQPLGIVAWLLFVAAAALLVAVPDAGPVVELLAVAGAFCGGYQLHRALGGDAR